MTKLANILRACGCAAALAATAAIGQPAILATFDENGHGLITGGSTVGLPDPFAVPGVLGVDPISGLTTLSYKLPTSTVTPGDVYLTEPDPITGQNLPSDLIRFGAGGIVYFFSDITPGEVGPFDMADVVGIPGPDPTHPPVILPEVGPEGKNGALYHPSLPTDPGFVGSLASFGPIVTYNLISDAVPEPTSLALLGLAGVAVLLRKRR